MVAHAPGSNSALTEFVFGSPDPNLAAESRGCAFSSLFSFSPKLDYSYFLPRSVSMTTCKQPVGFHERSRVALIRIFRFKYHRTTYNL